MKFSSWDLGGKAIFIATCLAFVSMFFTWVDIGFYSENGFEQESYIMLICFLYPIIKLLRSRSISKIGGYVCAIAGIVCGVAYINWKSGEVLGVSLNAAGNGPYVFIVASAILAFGVFQYDKQR
ncbi:hypothetical protein [Cohnella yongneupensis]|uniref:Uncharacterized protein n=1 Tax=Cohnella yongneupensis TaxID=425006 RepID=A0ABW0QVU9_9BACL